MRSGEPPTITARPKFYSITARGGKQLAVETENWERISGVVGRVLRNTTLLLEDRRELRTLISVEDLGRDLRCALRSLGRSRAFAAVAMASLGLGIGASTAIFSVIDNVLLAPFAYKRAGRMVFLRTHDTARAQEGGRQAYPSDELLEFAEQNHVFDGVVAASDDLGLYTNPTRNHAAALCLV